MQTVPNGVPLSFSFSFSVSVSIFFLPLLSHLYPSPSVLVFYCCWNKLPQTPWLKTAQMCYCICQKLEMDLPGQKSTYWQDCITPRGSREEPFSLPCPASRRHLRCLAPGLSSHLQISNCNSLTSAPIIISPSLTLTKTLLIASCNVKDLCDYLWPMQRIWDNLPISSLAD